MAPRTMGMGPAPASVKVLAQAALQLSQMDVIELNEAFAAQGQALARELGLQDRRQIRAVPPGVEAVGARCAPACNG